MKIIPLNPKVSNHTWIYPDNIVITMSEEELQEEAVEEEAAEEGEGEE